MRQYKDSGIEWIGKIPEDWKLSRLKFVLRSPIESGKRPNESEGKILSVGGEHIQNGNFDLSHPMYVTESTYFDNKGKIQLNDTLVVKDGATIGKCMYVKSMPNEKMLLNEHVYRISCSKFYYYWILSEIAQKWFRVRNQSTAQESITGPTIMNLPILVCSQTEQQRIVDFLDEKCVEIDSLIGLQEQMIEKLKAYKQSIITEAVTKGLDPNAKLVPSGIDWIGEIPEGWKVIKTKFIANKIFKGNGITKEEVFTDGDTPCVRYGEIYSKYSQGFKDCVSATNLDIQKSPQYFHFGDILCAGTGELVEEIGKSIVYLGNKACLAGGDIIIIRHSQNPSFLNYALNSNYAQTQKSRGKAKLKVVHISAFEIGSTYIILPPLSEQQTIANYLDEKCADIDRLISLKQQKIESLKDYKKSVIYEAVTGKTEIV